MGQSSKLAAARRAIVFLEWAFVIMLLSAVAGGALHVHLIEMMRQRQGVVGGIFSIGLVLGLLQLIGVGSSVLMMLGAERLIHTPKEARVISLAQTTLALVAVSLGLHLLAPQIPRLLLESHDVATLGPILSLVGFVQMGIDLAAFVVLGEAILRLRRFAAPDDRAVVNNEPLLRGGLIGLLTARLVLSSLSPAIAGGLASLGLPFDWTLYLIRMPFSVGIYVVLLWLLRRTESLL